MYKILLTPLELKPGMVTANPVMCENENDPVNNAVLLLPDTVLTENIIKRLISQKIDAVMVYSDEPLSRSPYYTPPPIKPVINEDLKRKAIDGIRDLFTSIGEAVSEHGNMTTAYQLIKDLNNVVDQLVDIISSEPNALVHISDLKSYDEYTYHHSLSVAVLSIAIGQEMGFDKEKLKKLGRCAIMHDIGKTMVPIEIINKPSRLTEEEFALIKQHSQNGGKCITQGQIADSEIWAGVLHHHEKWNGSGYPDKLKSDEIPLFARIISVADVYDAITSYRSYRSPMPPAEAVELVMSEVDRSFEYEIVKYFIKKLAPYPVNTVVELSDGRRGIVINSSHAMRPIIKLIDTDEILDLMDMKNLNLIITTVINQGN